MTDECIEWDERLDRDGYGRLHHEGKSWRAHRLVFLEEEGFLPPVVMHTCDNPPCVSIDHLEAGTIQLNNLDRDRKGHNRKKGTHCRRGHELTEDNVYHQKAGRTCKTCVLDRMKSYG